MGDHDIVWAPRTGDRGRGTVTSGVGGSRVLDSLALRGAPEGDGAAGGITLVTGAAGGIGSAVVKLLASRGFPVLASDINEAGLDRIQAETSGARGEVLTSPVDVAEPATVEALFSEVHRTGGMLSAVVHCAGITERTSLLETTVGQFMRLVTTNLLGGFSVITNAARLMVGQGRPGSIVVVTSINAQRPLASQPAYSATKAGLEALVSALAVEVAPHGVRVNAVAPGAIDTAMNPRVLHQQRTAHTIPLRRIGDPEEVAWPVAFLLSDEARYVTGCTMVVDGGLVHVRP
jgi:NAD(P)-dependent dehydrogenase (short-subunit alcohol dehydrogenase family)